MDHLCFLCLVHRYNRGLRTDVAHGIAIGARAYRATLSCKWGRIIVGMWQTVSLGWALGMDALSLCLALGMQRQLSQRRYAMIGGMIGVFHIVMPLLGMVVGHILGRMLGHTASWLGGATLVLLGGRMIYEALRGQEAKVADVRAVLTLVAFALGVSVDAFGAGMTLGVAHAPIVLTVLCIGACGALCAWGGFLLGHTLGRALGGYGHLLGGVTVIGYGIAFVLS